MPNVSDKEFKMTRHMANQGNSYSYEEGVWYDLVINEVSTDEGQYGPQVKFKLGMHNGESEEWVWASTKLGKHQGRVSKLRGIANALFHKPEGTEILWFDDETMEIKYENSVHRIEAGLKLQGKGEFFPQDDGTDKFKLTRFRMNSASVDPEGEAKKVEPTNRGEGVDPADIPF
jgi:hypothetical protein